jgi:putative ABC transport system substrate-binding protein
MGERRYRSSWSSSGFYALILLVLLAPLPAEGQRPAQPPRVGVLFPFAPGRNPAVNALREGLHGLGYVEGKSIILEMRWADARIDRQQAFVSELVRLPVDVLVVGTTGAALDARRLTTTIPIVTATAGALVEAGVVASLARPGGNVTGLTTMQADLAAKRLELLKEAVPKLSRVTALSLPTSRASLGEIFATQTEMAARSLGIELHLRQVPGLSDFDDAFQAAAANRADAVIFLPSPFFTVHAARVSELALKHRLPTMGNEEAMVSAGGLMAYSVNYLDMWRRAASYVDQILKGAKPADLPVEQPAKFELVINLKTARALGLTIPRSLLERADQVIE